MASPLADDIAAAARARAEEPDFPAATIDRIREAAARLAASEVAPDDVRQAIVLLEQHANVDADVPTASRVVPVRYLKLAIKKLVMWYLRYLTQQIALFGGAVARVATATALRLEALERAEAESLAERARLRDEITALEERIRALEARRG